MKLPPVRRGDAAGKASLTLRGVAIAIIGVLLGASGLASGASREIWIMASQYAYDPPRVRTALGDQVTLRIRSTDVTHGIYIDGYGLAATIFPSEDVVLKFVADRPGKIRYRCTVVCGNLHPFMVGEIVVEPNRPLWVSLMVGLLAAAGAVALHWRREAARDGDPSRRDDREAPGAKRG